MGGEGGGSSTSQLSRSLVGHSEEASPGDVTRRGHLLRCRKVRSEIGFHRCHWAWWGSEGPTAGLSYRLCLCSSEQLVSKHPVFLTGCPALLEGALFTIVPQYLFVEFGCQPEFPQFVPKSALCLISCYLSQSLPQPDGPSLCQFPLEDHLSGWLALVAIASRIPAAFDIPIQATCPIFALLLAFSLFHFWHPVPQVPCQVPVLPTLLTEALGPWQGRAQTQVIPGCSSLCPSAL